MAQNAEDKKGTFVVHIQRSRHATWQGKVVWAEKNESRSFRSALELLKIIESALEDEESAENEEEQPPECTG